MELGQQVWEGGIEKPKAKEVLQWEGRGDRGGQRGRKFGRRQQVGKSGYKAMGFPRVSTVHPQSSFQ